MINDVPRRNNGHWKLPPNVRDTLVETYQAAETLLTKPQGAVQLRAAFRHYFRYLMHLEIVADQHAAQHLLTITDTLDEGMLVSAISRLNCQVIRYLAGLSLCPQPCCCGCAATKEDLVCNKSLGGAAPLASREGVC